MRRAHVHVEELVQAEGGAVDALDGCADVGDVRRVGDGLADRAANGAFGVAPLRHAWPWVGIATRVHFYDDKKRATASRRHQDASRPSGCRCHPPGRYR